MASSPRPPAPLQHLAPRPQITLEDHTQTPGEHSAGLWARRAHVADYAIVAGSRTRAGAYVAWTCEIETFAGAHLAVRKRYSAPAPAPPRARDPH